MLLDLHAHTALYSACGQASPEEMVARALEVGLHGLVFSEHNLLWPEDELAKLQAAFPAVRLYRGIEITSSGGDDYIVYGVTDPDLLRAGMDHIEIVTRTRAVGGAIVLAHPYRYSPNVPEALDSHPVDGIEVMSSNIYNCFHVPALALAHRLQIQAIVTSDGHETTMLGMYAMQVDRLPENDIELAAVIRSGMMRPYIDTPRVIRENEALSAAIPDMLQMMHQGMTDGEVRDSVSLYVNLTVVRSLRLGRDILRPYQAVWPAHQASARVPARP